MALYLHWLRRDLRHHLPLYVVWFCIAGLCTWARLLLCHDRRENGGELLFLLRVEVGDFLPWCLAAEVAGAVLLLNSDPPDGTAVWWKTRPPSPQGMWLVKLTLCVIGVIGIPLFWELVYAWIARPVGGWSTALAVMALPLWPALCISPMLPRLRLTFFLLLPLAIATGTAAFGTGLLWGPQPKTPSGFVLLAWGLVGAGVLVSWIAWTRRGSLKIQVHTGLLLPGVMLLLLPAYLWLRDDDGFPRHPAPGVKAEAITAELTFPDVPLRRTTDRNLEVRLTLSDLPPRAGLRIRPEQVKLTDAAGNQVSFLASGDWIASVADIEGRTEIMIPAKSAHHTGPLWLSGKLRTVLHEAATVPVAVAEEQSVSFPDGDTGARIRLSENGNMLRIRIPDDNPRMPPDWGYIDYDWQVMKPDLVLRHKPTGTLQVVDLYVESVSEGRPTRFLEYEPLSPSSWTSDRRAKPSALALWMMPDGAGGGAPDFPGKVRSEWSAELTIRKLTGAVDIPLNRLPVIAPREWNSPTTFRRGYFNQQATDVLEEVTGKIRSSGKFQPENLREASQCLPYASDAAADAFAALLTSAEWRWAADMRVVHGYTVSELDGALIGIVPAVSLPQVFERREDSFPSNLSRLQRQILDSSGGRSGTLWTYLRASEADLRWTSEENLHLAKLITALIGGLKENQLWARGELLLHQDLPELHRWLSSVSDCPTEPQTAGEWIRRNAALVRWDGAAGRLVVP